MLHRVELATFPIEIVCTITQQLDGHAIARIWLSGDPRIIFRLERGGVTRFEATIAQRKRQSFPNLIYRFQSLESLSIRRYSRFEHSLSLWFSEIDLKRVSPTLKHLELDFLNAEYALLGLDYVVPDAFPDPLYSPKSEGEVVLAPLPLSEMFPGLLTLRLDGEPTSPSLLLPILPTTLQTLRLQHRLFSVHDVKRLPPNLTQLELPKCAALASSVPLPSKLTHLNIPTVKYSVSAFFGTLPRCLTYLNMAQCADSMILSRVEELPPQLQYWRFNWSKGFDHSTVKRLPQTLRNLHLTDIAKLGNLKILPPGLQTLVSFDANALSDEEILALPRTLTNLKLPYTTATKNGLKNLPSGLRKLALKVPFSALTEPYPFISSLEVLSSEIVDPMAIKGAWRLRKISTGHFMGDHSHLKGLNGLERIELIDDVKFEREWLQNLPDQLQELEINQLVDLLGSGQGVSQYLPRAMKSLVIYGQQPISDKFIQHLPRDLTSLIINSGCITLTDLALEWLPRGLRTLILPYARDVTDLGIKLMPRGLTALSLGRASLLTDEAVPHLPRGLQSLKLDNCTLFTNQSAKDFPRTLISLELTNNTNLTPSCIQSLPPCLLRYPCANVTIGTTWSTKLSTTAKVVAQNM